MPAYSERDDALAVKLLSFYPEATSHEAHHAWIMIFDPANGKLTAVSEVSCLSFAQIYTRQEK